MNLDNRSYMNVSQEWVDQLIKTLVAIIDSADMNSYFRDSPHECLDELVRITKEIKNELK